MSDSTSGSEAVILTETSPLAGMVEGEIVIALITGGLFFDSVLDFLHLVIGMIHINTRNIEQ